MTAKEYFDDVRVRAKRQQDALRGITNHGEDWHPGGGRSAGLSDTTATKAIARIIAEHDLQDELADIRATLAEARTIACNVGLNMGDSYKRVLEVYYIEAESLETTAKVLHVSKPTALRYRAAALEWIDYVGFAHAKEGTGKAT